MVCKLNFLIIISTLLCISSSARATVALDCGGIGCPTNAAAIGATIAVTLTTANIGDVINVDIKNGGNTILSVSDAQSLTWTSRITAASSGSAAGQEWYAIAAGALTADVITVTYNSNPPVAGRVLAYGVSGAATSSPFDPNSGAKVIASNAAATTLTVVQSTSNGADFLMANLMCSSSGVGTITRPSGFTQVVGTGSFQDSAYEIVSSPITSVSQTYSYTSTADCVMFTDAICAASGCAGGSTFPAPPHHRGIFG